MSQKTHATLKGIFPHSIFYASQNEEKEDKRKKRRKQTGTDQTSSITFSTLYSNTNGVVDPSPWLYFSNHNPPNVILPSTSNHTQMSVYYVD